MTTSQQSPPSAHGGKSGQKAHPAKTQAPTGTPGGPEPTGGPFRHVTAENQPRPKYETKQEDLPPQNDDVTTSAESIHLGEKYAPGSAPGGPATLKTSFKPRHGK